MIVRPISRLGINVQKERSILRHQRRVDFKAPEWVDFEAMERA